ncbi:MAG: Gfo/Idh/MocA family oxidoreductase [Caldilineaceae bacterium]|nr:Gfo/Idh/MocA family oxidoreductase [Caldilineaceae bacterium]
MTDQTPINVGIAGLGRTGWNNHANAFAHLPEQFRVVAVCDPDPERQAEAIERFDCLAYATYDELVADEAVELMVVATPSNLHAEQSIAAMRAGRHVIVEKPMASDLAGADAMIAVAKETGRILTVHQNLRYAADFVKLKEVIGSGVLGRIIEIRIHNGRFDRRWDWQTSKRFGGGMLNNSGPHFVDMGMILIDDPEPEVFCHMETTPLYAGDADSHVKVILKPKRGPLVEINIITACAFPQPNFLVLGTQGTLVCDHNEAHWRYFDPDDAPPLILDEAPIARDRTYNREQLPWKEERVPIPYDGAGNVQALYHSLYAAIREGAEPEITPESVRAQIAVLEKCRELNPDV